MVRVEGQQITVETKTCRAVFDRGWLVELRGRAAGAPSWVAEVDASAGSALTLVYANQPEVAVLSALGSSLSAHALSDSCAQYRFNGWDADGVLTISECPETGDVLVEPSAYSSRTGALAVRWRLGGFVDGLQLVAPFFQGTKLPVGDPLIQRRWAWPQHWEAGLAILEAPAGGGCWVHCRDTAYRPKALTVDAAGLGFETEAPGPLHTSRGSGGLVWRVNVYEGDWRVPAATYRDWWWAAYGLDEQAARRPAWHEDIALALSWYPGNLALLEALAERVDMRRVLIHFHEWRTDRYDENYPTYTPTEHAREVIARANELGAHILPHANSVDMDPTHPAYAYLRDFEYREVGNLRRLGWAWDQEANTSLGPPNSNRALDSNRRRKVMVKIHPGLAMWRSILCEEIQSALATAPNEAIFIDVTLCSHNLDQYFVENTSAPEGMNRLIRQLQAVNGGLVVAGEGLNEITSQGLSFCQAHLFHSWQATADGLGRVGGAALGDFIYGRLCRAFGYSNLTGDNEASELRMKVHEQLGAIPTITVGRPEQITNPTPAVARALDAAKG